MSQEWKLVPVEPTAVMISEGDRRFSFGVDKIYATMIAAAPVPPAGGEVEVLACLTSGGKALYFPCPNIEWRDGDIELVDRDHVTRLQADCEALAIMHTQAQVKWCAERDALKAEVKRLHGRLREEQTYVSELAAEHTAMESELTKARELLTHIRDTTAGYAHREKIDLLIAHQSAPAAKGGE